MRSAPQPSDVRSTTSQSARGSNAEMIQRLLASPRAEIPEGGYGLRVLTTTGRRTGRPHRTPVGVLRHDDHWYLVCPDRTRDWPRNLLARPECEVRIGPDQRHCRAIEVTGDAAAEIVDGYLSVVQAPWALRSFGLGDAPERADIAASVGRFGVFRLEAAADEKVVQ